MQLYCLGLSPTTRTFVQGTFVQGTFVLRTLRLRSNVPPLDSTDSVTRRCRRPVTRPASRGWHLPVLKAALVRVGRAGGEEASP
jgi:hypothetical protein